MGRRRPVPGVPCDDAAREAAAGAVPLALGLARRLWGRCGGRVPLDDLRGEALYALTRAAAGFDPGRGVPWLAYAALVVRRELLRAARRLWRRPLPFADLAPAGGPSDLAPAAADPADHREAAAPRRAASAELLARARRLLPGRYWRLLELRYRDGCTLAEAGAALGISKERVRQLERKAEAMLRRPRGGPAVRKPRPAAN